MRRLFKVTMILAVFGSCMLQSGFAQEEKADPRSEDLQSIAAAVASYGAAFNERDAETLASHWAPEGVYINRTTGDKVTGRANMVEAFKSLFAGEGAPTLELVSESIEFISPNVALERGAATITNTDETVSLTRYKVIFVQQGGKWLIDRVTEDEIQVAPASNYEHLQGLEWIIGSWVDASDGVSITTECSWTKNQNFISRKYVVSQEGDVESTGLQIIGWDPKNERIRSWLFDSNGGFISGTWEQSGERWIVQSVATLPDGASGSFTSIFRPLEDDSFGWHKINRVLDGELLPNVDEVIVTRQ
jgi:uncharacterized protein (TIGR02246 family)